jgi:apolipoprotein N-acyltransferase
MTHFTAWMTGKRAWVSALLCGLCAMLALPPISLWPLVVPAYSGLLLLLLHAPRSQSALFRGWLFGMGYFVPGLYWFAIALLTEPEKFAWMIPFAVLGLPALLSIYYALAAWLVWRGRHLPPLLVIFNLALIWLATEWLRGHLFTGFPWNPAALSWSFSVPMLQLVSILGSYGVIWWTVLLAALPSLLVWPEPVSEKIKHTGLALCLVMLSLQFSYGYWRLSTHQTEYTDTQIRIVQPNIQQPHKWDPDKQVANVRKQLQMSQYPGMEALDVIIWSETAFPYILEPRTPMVYGTMDYLPKQALLITGALRAEPVPPRSLNLFNSLHVVTYAGEVPAYYDKIKLVPFGEFIPFRGILPVEKITHGMQDFSVGHEKPLLEPNGLPAFIPLICYEAIFPELSQQAGAEWMVNITNDAWFGTSVGPYQHLEMTRLRAVEQGLPLARAANSGISALFDSYGRILSRLPLNSEGIIDMTLPQPAPLTLFNNYKYLWVFFILFLHLLIVFVSLRHKKLTLAN